MMVLMWKHKHGTSLFDASTNEALDKSAREVLRLLLEEFEYIFKPDPEPYYHAGIDLELAELTDEQINQLPAEPLKELALEHRKMKRRADTQKAEELAEYDAVLRVVAGEQVMSPDWVRQADSRDGKYKKGDVMPGKPITAWRLLQDRSGYEYEVYSLEEVWTP